MKVILGNSSVDFDNVTDFQRKGSNIFFSCKGDSGKLRVFKHYKNPQYKLCMYVFERIQFALKGPENPTLCIKDIEAEFLTGNPKNIKLLDHVDNT